MIRILNIYLQVVFLLHFPDPLYVARLPKSTLISISENRWTYLYIVLDIIVPNLLYFSYMLEYLIRCSTCASAMALDMCFCISALASFSFSSFSRRRSKSLSKFRNLPNSAARSLPSASANLFVSSNYQLNSISVS